MKRDKTFHIGLCMAGAISAGAYTAGVIDYLFEALEEWEKRRGEENVPSHKVQISAIGGASAGGMTSIITASIINRAFRPVALDPDNLLKEQPQNPFYHAWVDLTDKDMFSQMLNTADITNHKIYSLLNSSFIDTVAERTINAKSDNWIERNYIAQNLKVFATLTNLEGFCARIPFMSATGKDNYLMTTHNDYGCFVLNPDSTAERSGWIPLSFRDNINTDIAREVAMATGAFPVGLRARKVSRPKSYIHNLSWLEDSIDGSTIINEPYETLNIDGGLINNEPFERVRQILSELTGQTSSEDIHNYNLYKSTVLMIDPFPSEMEKFDASDTLFKVMGSTLSAMIGQLRTKPAELRDAMNSACAGQYLIAPTRYIPYSDGSVVKKEGSKAIACGSFAGFGGFLNKEFRIHDYLLGRANCEKFLLDHFTVPADTDNPLFIDGYANVDKEKFRSQVNGHIQIIPVFKERKDPFPLARFTSGHDWPVISESQIRAFRPLIKRRAQALLMNSADMGKFSQFLLWTGSRILLNRKLADMMHKSIKGSLVKHQLLK